MFKEQTFAEEQTFATVVNGNYMFLRIAPMPVSTDDTVDFAVALKTGETETAETTIQGTVSQRRHWVIESDWPTMLFTLIGLSDFTA